jgi:hypothetical protein
MPDTVPLLLFWDSTKVGFTIDIKVTTETAVVASAEIIITTNGVAKDLTLDEGQLAHWHHQLADNQKVEGMIILTYSGSGKPKAHISAECRDAHGSPWQTSYDADYQRNAPAVQPVGVSAT